MRGFERILLTMLAVSSAVLGSLAAPEIATPGKGSLAQQVIDRAARVREGDRVQIAGPPGEATLLEDLAVQARRRGAHPLITLVSDALRRRYIEEVPPRFDSVPPRLDLALAEACDVFVGVENSEDALIGLPPARMAAQQKASERVVDRMLERNVRTVWLGNGLYPTPRRARRFGLTEDQLRKVYTAGLAADPVRLADTGARLRKILAAGKQLHLQSDDGTDLTLSIAKQPVLVSDGVLTPEKEKKGGAACVTWLPAGEVYLTPVPDSANGTIVGPLVFWEGEVIRRLRLTFRKGKLTGMTADSGLDRLSKVYASHGAGKERLGAVDIGINPGVQPPPGSLLRSFIAEGTITVALGNNTWAGGDVNTPFGLNVHLTQATLRVDDTVLVASGRLR
ncbi:MAG: aminopeptidase [Gemmataceae bacterium]